MNEVGMEITLTGICCEPWRCKITKPYKVGHYGQALALNGNAAFSFEIINGQYITRAMLDTSRLDKMEF
jgi:hypothetical protein